MDVYETHSILFVEFWNRIIYWKFAKKILTCRRMSILKMSLGIVKITNNNVNQINFYDDCPFKTPIL